LTRAIDLAEPAGLLGTAARAHNNLGVALESDFGELKAARDHFFQARTMARRVGIATEELVYLINATNLSMWLGDFAAVEETLPTLRRLLSAAGESRPAATGIRGLEARLLHYRGEWDEAVGMLLPERDAARRLDDRDFLAHTNTYLADTWLELGQWDPAEEALVEAVSLTDQGHGDHVWARCLLGVVRLHYERVEDARRLLLEARTTTRHRLTTFDKLQLSWFEARIFAETASWAETNAAFESAVDLANRSGIRWHRARMILEWAEAHRSHRIGEGGEPNGVPRPERLVELLKSAKALFDELKVPRYTAQAEYQLWMAERIAQA
jgi:tetratricopeptide (TPR) repeat protein